jgi:2-polyprenyl-6-hydroxyphenyl methylase/3-demethylubiquinone-9 3-methyltransferase
MRSPWAWPQLASWWLHANPLLAELRWREEQAVLAHVQELIRPHQNVIELGCGGGWYTKTLARHCRSLQAVDRAPAMLEYLGAHLFRAGLTNVELIQAEVPECLDSLALADGVVTCGLLDYVGDLQTTLHAICRVLRPGGWLVATVPAATLPGRAATLIGRAMGHRVHATSVSEAVTALRAAGFRDITATTVGLIPPGRTLVLRGRIPEQPPVGP